MSGMSAFWGFPLLEQNGTPNADAWYAVISSTDGSTVLAGFTEGNWEGETNGNRDFAAVSLDADGKEMWRYQVSGFPRGDLPTGSRCLYVNGIHI